MLATLEWLQQTPAALYSLSAVLGALLGSLLNVIIYRLPIMLRCSWAEQCVEYLNAIADHKDIHLNCNNPLELKMTTPSRFNLWVPRSHCPQCKKPIKAWDNIPLLSFLWLKARCRQCQAAIPVRYFAIELFSCLITLCSIAYWGPTLAGLSACLLSYALICLMMIDHDTELLPDEITLSFLWLGLLFNQASFFCTPFEALLGATAGYLSLWSFYWIFKLLTGKEGMGYGDFKMFGMLGAWLGVKSLAIIILLASIAGSVIGLILIHGFNRDRAKPIRFGPYLAVAGWIALFFQQPLLQFYLGA